MKRWIVAELKCNISKVDIKIKKKIASLEIITSIATPPLILQKFLKISLSKSLSNILGNFITFTTRQYKFKRRHLREEKIRRKVLFRVSS